MRYAINPKVTVSSPDEVIEFFQFTQSFLLHCGPAVYSACNRNEYQKQNKCFWGIERGQCVRLTTLPPSISLLSRQCAIPCSSQPHNLHGQVTFQVVSPQWCTSVKCINRDIHSGTDGLSIICLLFLTSNVCKLLVHCLISLCSFACPCIG
jgi:hypothetical protein